MAADHLAGAAGDAIRAQSPFDRVATPDEVARAAVFLASPGTGYERCDSRCQWGVVFTDVNDD